MLYPFVLINLLGHYDVDARVVGGGHTGDVFIHVHVIMQLLNWFNKQVKLVLCDWVLAVHF